jgi:dienelactone hydrolase
MRWFLAAVAIVVGAAAAWLGLERAALSRLRPAHDLRAAMTAMPAPPGRRLAHVVLEGGALGPIGIVLSLPEPLPARPLPVVMVLGGAETGAENIAVIPAAGDNAIIGFDWPMPLHLKASLAAAAAIPAIYREILSTPAAIASALEWCAARPWADRHRVSVLGYSLGALAAPAAEDLAERDGLPIGWTILAYGGAPIAALIAANPHFRPAWLRDGLAPVVGFLVAPLDPVRHLPDVSSRFLVLEGRDDNLVPAAARARLRDAVPAPREVMVFPGSHMGVGPGKRALLEAIIAASRAWLLRQGAVNPP